MKFAQDVVLGGFVGEEENDRKVNFVTIQEKNLEKYNKRCTLLPYIKSDTKWSVDPCLNDYKHENVTLTDVSPKHKVICQKICKQHLPRTTTIPKKPGRRNFASFVPPTSSIDRYLQRNGSRFKTKRGRGRGRGRGGRGRGRFRRVTRGRGRGKGKGNKIHVPNDQWKKMTLKEQNAVKIKQAEARLSSLKGKN